MATWDFTKGLHDIGKGTFAYLQPDGGWGFSNAGLIVDGEESLLVDTLFDLALTGEMLDTMRGAVPQARAIGTLVNTHSNGDHTFGNQLVDGATIVASAACAEEMRTRGPDDLAAIMREAPGLGEGGKFLLDAMGPHKFDFEGISYTLPTQTFEQALTLTVGDRRVDLVNVGPAHTGGDVLVHLPDEGVVFTGDILFNEGHPIIWAGPVENWIAACDRILDWNVDIVVPGHGAITDKGAVANLRGYFVYIDNEARQRFEAGLTVEEAALDIAMDDYDHWLDRERIVINVQSLFRQYGAPPSGRERIDLFAMMARYHRRRAQSAGKSA